jgi:hypothetical protein
VASSANLRFEDAKCKFTLLADFFALNFIVISFVEDSFASTVFEAETELADVYSAIKADFTSDAFWKAVDEPALVDILVSTFNTSLELQNSAKTMEVLGVDEHLTLVNEIGMLGDAHKLKLKSIWFMDQWALVGV